GTEVTTHALPESGVVVIGRAEGSAVRIEHTSISRSHALLRMGQPITIEDLGSANGTHLRGLRLAPREPVSVSLGESIELGAATLGLPLRPEDLPAPSRKGGPALAGAKEGTMGALEQRVERIAPSALHVLILGETGVGKEVWAERIHRLSPRASKQRLA